MTLQSEDSYLTSVFIKLDPKMYKKKLPSSFFWSLQTLSVDPSPFLHGISNNNLIIVLF